MKKILRYGVFETNSSSSHSLSLSRTKERQERIEELKQEQRKASEKADAQEFLTGKRDVFQSTKNLVALKTHEEYMQIISPIAKMVWFLGIVDHAEGTNGIGVFDDYPNADQNDNKPKRTQIRHFKNMLIDEFCKLENLTFEEAKQKLLDESCKFVPFEDILKSKYIEKEVASLLERNEDFAIFAEDYSDKVLAFKDFVKEDHKTNCSCCNGRFSCRHYFEENAMYDCDCGFDGYNQIFMQFEEYKRELTFEELAKEFLTNKHEVLGKEFVNDFICVSYDKVY